MPIDLLKCMLFILYRFSYFLKVCVAHCVLTYKVVYRVNDCNININFTIWNFSFLRKEISKNTEKYKVTMSSPLLPATIINSRPLLFHLYLLPFLPLNIIFKKEEEDAAKCTEKNSKVAKSIKTNKFSQKRNNITAQTSYHLLATIINVFKNSVKNKEITIFKNCNEVHKTQRVHFKVHLKG